MKNSGLALALALALVSVAGAQDSPGAPAEPRIPIIQMENVPLAVAIANLGRQAEFNFTLDPKITAAGNTNAMAPVSLRWENLTARAALTRILKERGLFLVDNPQTGVARITVTNSPPRAFDQELFAGSKELIPLIVMDDVPLEVAFAQLGAKTNLRLELDATLTDPARPFRDRISVSVRFKDLTAGQAVTAICDQHNLQITRIEQTGVWRVSRGK